MSSEPGEAVPRRPPPVAIIDIGSNTIKLLVAALDPESRRVREYGNATRETRITSHGNGLILTEDAMVQGVKAVKDFVEKAQSYSPQRTIIVATSAVREAPNRQAFSQEIQESTGIPLRILSGEEEARAIGRGVSLDPAIEGEEDFYVFDLGGGSLECIEFTDRTPAHIVSLPLGAVRLTHRFVADPSGPFSITDQENIQNEVVCRLRNSAFPFSLPASSPLVGTGGTLAVCRSILAAREERGVHEQSPLLRVAEMKKLLMEMAPLSLERRRAIEGLPHGRADVFPAALTVLITIASCAKAEVFIHSFYNLRYGFLESP
ncbi:MAG: phosphatase [Opitutales bacterium]